MKFLEQVQADLKQAVLQHQRDLLVTVLRGRSAELTLGDLRKLLASPLGRGLDDLRVAELFAGPAASSAKVSTTVHALLAAEAELGVHEDRAGKAHSKKRASAKKKATKAQQRAAIPAVLTQADYDAAVLANLNATGSMSSSQLQASVGGSLNEVRAALQRLIENQQVTRLGQHRNTRYVPGGSKSPSEVNNYPHWRFIRDVRGRTVIHENPITRWHGRGNTVHFAVAAGAKRAIRSGCSSSPPLVRCRYRGCWGRTRWQRPAGSPDPCQHR